MPPPLTTYQTSGIKTCPAPTPVFTGRQGKLDQIKACISNGARERCVFVLHGLGGAGKTQLALKAVQDTWDMWADILFVDATSRETATRTLEAFAKERKVGQTHQDMIRWLGSWRERWLMVFDNADDPSLALSELFPIGNHGSILVTTRLGNLSLLARGVDSDIAVSGMGPGDALKLLLKTAGMQKSPLAEAEGKAAEKLLEASISFGYLALAIVQAGAYIRCSQRTIDQYCAMFFKHRKATLEKYRELLVKVDDYQRSVYTTWHMSYIRLGSNAQRLLHLMAFMHHDGITEDIFRRGAVGLPKYKPAIPVTDKEAEVTALVMRSVRPYLDSTSAWDSGAFLTTMTELMSYSLVGCDRANGAYTMHVLVHDWASTVINCPLELAIQCTALLLAVSIDYGNTMESLAYKRGVEVHVNRVLGRQSRPSANNAARFAEVYRLAGKWKQEQKLREIELEGTRRALGDGHDSTLTAMHNLAVAYLEQGKYKQAEQMLSEVVASRKRSSGEADPSTLTSMHQLARTYSLQGRYQKAVSLQIQVADTRKRTLGEEDPRTLSSMYELANTYKSLGQHGQAESLLVQVVAALKRVSGEEHPDTLDAMHALASTYCRQRRYEQAELLQVQVVEARKRVSGDEHHDTLASMSNLAVTYRNQRRYDEAEALQVQVLEAMKRVYGEDHPGTLTTMGCLAGTYWSQGRYDQAEKLQVHVLHVRQRVLGSRHPCTLHTMHELSATYQSLGTQRRKQYEELQAGIRRLEALS
ncbi:hypothetical protein FRC10_010577 [Ceratobasidium sp. 414]|nr:hypothetical protein FRC10_010577 [Ceratobasidium sp. 414]